MNSVRLAGGSAAEDSAFAYFCWKFHKLTGIDLSCYKPVQLKRRLTFMMEKVNAGDLVRYGRMIAEDRDALEALRDFIGINVSEFFRNPEKFRELKEVILPGMASAARSGLRMWSAGCANGAEPYSLALVALEAFPGGRHRVLATDVDRAALEATRRGVYTRDDLRNVPARLLATYFKRVDVTTEKGDGKDKDTQEKFEVAGFVRRMVEVRYHNLLSDPFEPGFHLIACRNVMIYFTDGAKLGLLRRLREALAPEGVLFLGGTEAVPNPREFGLRQVLPFFYTRDS